MIKEEKILKENTIYHKYCDDCETEIKFDMACLVAKCEICGKDLCNNCVEFEESNTGYYRTVYCKKCWEIGEPYRNQIELLENKIEELSEEWYKKCKK